jgi:hypothetical protein
MEEVAAKIVAQPPAKQKELFLNKVGNYEQEYFFAIFYATILLSAVGGTAFSIKTLVQSHYKEQEKRDIKKQAGNITLQKLEQEIKQAPENKQQLTHDILIEHLKLYPDDRIIENFVLYPSNKIIDTYIQEFFDHKDKIIFLLDLAKKNKFSARTIGILENMSKDPQVTIVEKFIDDRNSKALANIASRIISNPEASMKLVNYASRQKDTNLLILLTDICNRPQELGMLLATSVTIKIMIT